VERPVRPLIYGLAGFYLFGQIRELLDGAPILARYLFSAEVVAAFAFVIWLTRPARLAKIERPTRALRLAGMALRSVLALMVVAFLANLLGYFAFASILGQGTLTTLYAAVILYGAYRVARIVVSVILRTDAVRQLRMVRVGAARIEHWAERILRIAAIVYWLDIALSNFTIRDSVVKALLGMLTASFEAGTISVSLGDILAFVLTIAAAFLVSRFIRFVLQEDVFPRVVMRRGVSNAVSTTVHYAILIFGFLLALAAAGFDLSRVTLLAGAFGVGIGFGLQNVVNNFVSGLILLFERPIQVGDTIEVQGLLGDVRRIGPRSSTVRTFDGAEVIVPNGMLISDQVINWTLSDRRRRVVVGVGVAYGTDPEQVLEILREVAQENETVQDDPAPLAIFMGFGDSSLDFELRCWIPRYEEGFSMRSQLWVAINRKLAEAGIEIPFPQRDLHLRSVDTPASGALSALRRSGDSADKKSGS
jgi:small-conductance mechanosensitive channel